MKTPAFRPVVLAIAASITSGATQAAVLFSETFDSDVTSSWTVNDDFAPDVNSADFYFDYSTVGIPSAPSSGGTTRGLKLQADLKPSGAATTTVGLTVSPTGQSFTGNYTLAFDWWSNYNGPLNGGGSGTTQVSQFGVGTAGTSTQYIGTAAKDGVSFAATGDGGSAFDYRAYSSAAPSSYNFALTPLTYSSTYAPAGAQDASNAYYTGLFAGVSAPAAQLGEFPDQTGVTNPGAPGFRWNAVQIQKLGDTIAWYVNGTVLAIVQVNSQNPDGLTALLGGSNILFGVSDVNNSPSADASAADLLFTLIDNVRVTNNSPVPLPAAAWLLLSGAGALGVFGRRRKPVAHT